MTTDDAGPRVSYRTEIGAAKRRLYILEDVIDAGALEPVHVHFRSLTYGFCDSDRSDTSHVRHLAHLFDPCEWDEEPILRILTDTAREFLEQEGQRTSAIQRIYANFNLFGDYQFAHDDGDCWTALVFMNSTWHEDWGGELLVYDDDTSMPALAIPPRPGRMVLFDGQLVHRGGVPSKHCLDARITLAIKLDR